MVEMEVSWFCVLFLLRITLTISDDESVYDAQNCGLPGPEFAEQRAKRLSSNVTSAQSESNDDSVVPKSMYYPDYEEDYSKITPRIKVPMEGKVVGDRDALMGEFPWSVSIELDGNVCGGTLVSKRHIITAAHCFLISTPSGLCSVRHMYPVRSVLKHAIAIVGGICREEDRLVQCTDEKVGKKIRIKSAHYEGFFKERCSGTRDIAFVELEENVPDGVHHACLPHMHNVDDLDESTARLFSSGWKTNPLSGTVLSAAPIQQLTDLGLRMTNEECKKKRLLWPDMFCTLEISDQVTCQGNSGAGVTVSHNGRHYLVGVVSRGAACTDLVTGLSSGVQAHTDIAFYTADIDNMLEISAKDRREEWRNINL